MSDDLYDDVVHRLYGAVLSPDEWQQALLAVSRYVGGVGAVYLRADRRTTFVEDAYSVGIDPAAKHRYLTQFADKEVRLPRTFQVPVGRVVTEQSLIDLRTLRRSEIYNELLVPCDIPYIASFTPERSDTHESTFVIERTALHGPADREAIERLQRLVPHLTRALHLRRALGELTAERRALTEWLDRCRQAVLFVDPQARILRASPAAEALLRRADALRVGDGAVALYRADDTGRLRRAIASASTGRRMGASLTIDAARAPVLIHVVPVLEREQIAESRASALLVVIDTLAVGPSPTTIQNLLRLTPAEARLAAALYRHGKLPAAARHLRLSVHTCRTQMKSIYAKTGCHCQADLTRRLAQMPADTG